MKGERVWNVEPHLLKPGQYTKWSGEYYAVPPDTALLAGLRAHKIDEHPDGTITVSPSILVSQGDQSWHGYLEKGVWRKQ
jgi:hypothetical protein